MIQKGLLLLLLGVFAQCTSPKSEASHQEMPGNNPETIQDTAKVMTVKKVLFDCKELRSYNGVALDSNALKSGKRIISFLRMDCPSCVIEIQKWDSLVRHDAQLKDVKIFFVLRGDDSEYTRFQLTQRKHFEFPILYDEKNSFIANPDTFYMEEGILILNGDNDVLHEQPPLSEAGNLEDIVRKLES